MSMQTIIFSNLTKPLPLHFHIIKALFIFSAVIDFYQFVCGISVAPIQETLPGSSQMTYTVVYVGGPAGNIIIQKFRNYRNPHLTWSHFILCNIDLTHNGTLVFPALLVHSSTIATIPDYRYSGNHM